MKTLSIRQPWASLIVKGFKDVENRSWRTPIRGEIAIHASASKTEDDWDDDWDASPMEPKAATSARSAPKSNCFPARTTCRHRRLGRLGRCSQTDRVDA